MAILQTILRTTAVFVLLLAAIVPCSDLPAVAQASPANPPAQADQACINYYYGVGIPKSYEKAFACFQKGVDGVPSYLYLILMTLNGEGTIASVSKAREFLTEARERSWGDPFDTLGPLVSGECCNSDWIDTAANLVAQHEKEGGGSAIGICDFTNGPRMDRGICFSELESVWEDRYQAELEPITAKLSASARDTYGEVKKLFQQLQAADAAWAVAELFNPGQDSPYAEASADIFDMSHFARLVKKVVKDHGLRRRTVQELQAQDKALNAAYHKRIDTMMADWDEQLKDPDLKERWAEIRDKKTDFADAAKKAQRTWIKMIEPWKKLCQELYRGEMPPEEIDRAIETELREVRIPELANDSNYDPIMMEMQ